MTPAPSPEITLRPFARADFDRLISWVDGADALADWCAAFFVHPLDHAQLTPYLESVGHAQGRAIFAAVAADGAVVGHVELGHVWPHLSSRLSRVLVAPAARRRGIGAAMVARAATFSFATHDVDRIDLGVAADNAAAIACYRRVGFAPVGTWPQAMSVGGRTIDVTWMTLARRSWDAITRP
jgi:RimJ/RimL family protein N-acetyltransferase